MNEQTDNRKHHAGAKDEAARVAPVSVAEGEDPSLPPPPPIRKVLKDVPLDAVLEKQSGNSLSSTPITKKTWIIGSGVAAIVLLGFMLYSSQPRQGSMAYGLCSVFLELHTPYPHTLQYTGVEGARIYYTDTDPFGQYRHQMIECTYAQTPSGGVRLAKVARNRRPVDAIEIEKFNKIMPVVQSLGPDLTLPPEWKNPLLKE